MAYPGDFVVANRAARDAGINFYCTANKPRHRRDVLRRIYFRVWEWLAKRSLPRIYSTSIKVR
jgi:hypothetical protein